MKKTKIVCTIGPATCDSASIKQLIDEGMNIARLNGSHNTLEWHRNVRMNSIARDNKRCCSVWYGRISLLSRMLAKSECLATPFHQVKVNKGDKEITVMFKMAVMIAIYAHRD